MKKIWLLIIIVVILSFFLPLSPIYSQVKEPGLITLGKYQIGYDEFFKDDTNEDGIVDKISYFMKGNLVLTIWDNNQDGIPDSWFRYDEEEYLILQADDLNADGKPDEFLYFDQEEKVIKKEREVKAEEETPTESPFLSEKPEEEFTLPKEKTLAHAFISDQGQLTLTIDDSELKSKDSGELAWILSLTMKAETDLRLYATEYWFVYPDCPEEDVYVRSDLESLFYEYPHDPARDHDVKLTDSLEKWYDAGEEVSRRFTLPLCTAAYSQYKTTRVDLVQAVEYYLTPDDTVETLEWEFSSP
jgi:hypothetical protein